MKLGLIKTLGGIAILTALSPAWSQQFTAGSAGTVNVGTVSTPGFTYGNSFTTNGAIFDDHYDFTIAPSGVVDSITSTITLGTSLGLTSFSARLYSGPDVAYNVKPAGGAIDAWSTATTLGAGMTGTDLVIPTTVLSAGNYVLELTGTVSGTLGGNYAGSLNLSPVPEAQSWVLMLAGLVGLGGLALRRRRA